ncbi:MAG: tripartite tricarboxylate transporter substrate binding protein [Pseudomonadota bacterium]|nr:tripartite tricarboxylate transporter substrate binding protein [Pseudomonadota bacterium]
MSPARSWRVFGPSILALSLGLAAAGGTGTARAADAWPVKPIHFIVPFTAGGANDLMARAAAEGVATALHQQVIVENKPGAGTMLGTAFVARAPADGYTLLVSSAGVVSNSLIRDRVPYKDSDLTPVALIALAPSIVVAPADAPYNDLKDFVAASKAGKGKLFATAGTGSTPHFVAGLLSSQYGAQLEVVPYKSGSESVTAVLGGQVDATSEASIVVLPYLKSGKLKALADAWSTRVSAYPALSTAVEQGYPAIRIAHWAGLHAPAGTPPGVLDTIAAAVDAAMKTPAIALRLKTVGIEPGGGTRAAFAQFIDEERERLGAVVKSTHMKAD